jgi:hypothetical protein
MKTFLTTLLLATLALSSMAAPQRQLSNAPLTANMSTNVAFSTGTANTISVTVAASNNVASIDQTVVTCNTSLDGQNWSYLTQIILTNAGTATAYTMGSVTVGAADQLQLSVSNTTANANLTNYVTIITNKKAKL